MMHHRAALKHIRAIGQGQHEIEIMLDDDHRDFPAQAVEGLDQFLEEWNRTLWLGGRSGAPNCDGSYNPAAFRCKPVATDRADA
jgi:hypothetical protein